MTNFIQLVSFPADQMLTEPITSTVHFNLSHLILYKRSDRGKVKEK